MNNKFLGAVVGDLSLVSCISIIKNLIHIRHQQRENPRREPPFLKVQTQKMCKSYLTYTSKNEPKQAYKMESFGLNRCVVASLVATTLNVLSLSSYRVVLWSRPYQTMSKTVFYGHNHTESLLRSFFIFDSWLRQ